MQQEKLYVCVYISIDQYVCSVIINESSYQLIWTVSDWLKKGTQLEQTLNVKIV